MIWQFIINVLITGILYSLLAIGFALVYNTTRIFHIAAAGIYVFTAYMFLPLVAKAGLPVISASIIAVILTMGISMLSKVTASQYATESLFHILFTNKFRLQLPSNDDIRKFLLTEKQRINKWQPEQLVYVPINRKGLIMILCHRWRHILIAFSIIVVIL